jgi:hypothetical protein
MSSMSLFFEKALCAQSCPMTKSCTEQSGGVSTHAQLQTRYFLPKIVGHVCSIPPSKNSRPCLSDSANPEDVVMLVKMAQPAEVSIRFGTLSFRR